jgi:DNA-directed RNA polymerase subunit RPC12/RpoP
MSCRKMATIGSTWIVILQCYKCDALFTLKGVPAIAIKATTDSSQCPKCGSKRVPKFPTQKKHSIVDLLRHRLTVSK